MISRQTMQRLHAWMKELPNHLYTPLAPVNVEGFCCMERLNHHQAEKGDFHPFPAGTAWGRKWEYGWFRTKVVLPDICIGKRIVFFCGVGGEQLLYVNGNAKGSIDKQHQYITLTNEAKAGDTFDILIESYAGHGPRLEGLGPCPPDRTAVPEPPAFQCKSIPTFPAIWNEDAYQLLMDADCLCKLLQILPEKSLRAQKVLKALVDFTHIADFEVTEEKRNQSFSKAREVLSEAMQCHNGSTAPYYWLIGQSHIDLAWLWPLEETYHKAARTYSTQLELMDEYPEYRFLLCEPKLLKMLEEEDPEIWQRVRNKVESGQILQDGAFYVESDTNLPSGESLIRQLLCGKKWYKKEFGIDSQVAWQPDTFGFSAALPQIMRSLNIPYFATQKLLRADPECDRFPYQHFIWEGLDGSEVLSLSFFKANAQVDPVNFHNRWENDRVQQENIDTLLYPFGYGDGGGGATRDMLEQVRRLKDLEGLPRSGYGSLREYFEKISHQGVTNRWTGELYLSWHRGTYTAQRRQKMLMRQAETALHNMETFAALTGKDEYQEILAECWDKVLLCQFHDMAAGVGIQRTHSEASAMLQSVLNELNPLIHKLANTFFQVEPGSGMIFCNPLPIDRQEWICLPDGTLQYICIPALGAASAPAENPAGVSVSEDQNGFLLENEFMKVYMDHKGRILSILDLENHIELMDPGQKMNDWRLYQNVESTYDAWELSRDWKQCLLAEAMDSSARISFRNASCVEISVIRQFGHSTAEQKVRFMAHDRRIHFDNTVDWHERHRMLKAHFESNIHCMNAKHEIQFGYIERPCHPSTQHDRDQYEVCNHRYSALTEENRGFALLNNGIYGLSSDRGELALSLLRSPLVPDDTCDIGVHHFEYELYIFAKPFAESGTTEAAYCLNNPPICISGNIHGLKESIHLDSKSLLIETIKPADDKNGIILRIYESKGLSGTGILHLPFDADIRSCDMAETENGKELTRGRLLSLHLAPFKIMTLRIIPE